MKREPRVRWVLVALLIGALPSLMALGGHLDPLLGPVASRAPPSR